LSGPAGVRLGQRGEEAVARWLVAKGWTIAARRLVLPAGEVDLLAVRGDRGLLVEVKTTAGAYALADRVDARKRRRLAALGEQVCVRFELDRVQLAVAAVVWTTQSQQIALHELELW
jgi:putative endonuclease